MRKSSIQNLAKLSMLPVILILLFYCSVMMVAARGAHVTNHGIESDDDDMKQEETSLPVSGKRLEPLHSAAEYRLVTASQQMEMELRAGNNKSKAWAWSQQQQQQQPFQLCLVCKCCMSAAAPESSTCTSMPCCFVIDCQLPNKPYGVCAFVPKTCNCTSCAAPLL